MDHHYPVIIIGGGISGVSCAQFFANNIQGRNCLIIESQDKLGGCIETYYLQKNIGAKDFWIELGAHTIYNSYAHLIQYCENNKLFTTLKTRKNHPFKLLKNSKICSIPSKLNLIRAGIGWPLFKLTSAGSRSVSHYFSFVFGKKNYNQTFRYCFDAVLCQDSRYFPANFLFKTHRKNKKFPRSFTFERGLSHLFANYKHTNITFSMNTTCQKIIKQNNLWTVHTNKGIVATDQLILAIPWHITQQLLAKINHPISAVGHQPKVSKLCTVGLILNQAKIQHVPLLNGLIGIKDSFFSMVTRDVIMDKNYRGFTIHFKESEQSTESLVDDFLYKLHIPKNAIVEQVIKYNSVPCYQTNHQLFLDQLDQLLEDDQQLGLTGNYFTRLAVEDCVKRSHQEFLRLTKS